MSFGVHRILILLFCIGLLTAKFDGVCSLRSMGIAVAQKGEAQEAAFRSRILTALTTEDLNTATKPASASKKFNPNQASKRRVRRGSDPIHNRS
ncbi:hypothetical protein Nepgr_028005 [Nepenthes gracilis]|uniref:Uncharacterized protein n=1 Tax=Nepenthes gracilis TaxID=150966 RepID=A0AAD3TCT2_NEPGR|nr:hypothetical protein Nepgr_028005 [Nepenthes gracilis]